MKADFLLDGPLAHHRTLGRVARLPLKLLPRGRTVRILSGPAIGMRWVLGSGPHSCWLGINEREKRQAIASALTPGSVFYDVGAHVGSYMLLASRQVGRHGRVVAYEPVPRNLEYLHEHIKLNALANVAVIPVALSDRAGEHGFRLHEDTVQGALDSDGELRVRCATIDGEVGSGAPPPDVIKIDVEGAELAVLEGARQTLAANRPGLFVAVHSDDLARQCTALMQDCGYVVRRLGSKWELHGRPC